MFAGAATPAVWLIALGAWLAIRLGAKDPLVGLQTAGDNVITHLGGATGLLLSVVLAAGMGMNAYSAMLTTLAGVDAFHTVKPTRSARVITILVLTVIWFVIGTLTTTSAVAVVPESRHAFWRPSTGGCARTPRRCSPGCSSWSD